MSFILHFFYGPGGELWPGHCHAHGPRCGSACFPFPRAKQAISAEKMKAIQPEMEKIKEKYKNKDEAARAPDGAVSASNEVNPFGGLRACSSCSCRSSIGLYRGLPGRHRAA